MKTAQQHTTISDEEKKIWQLLENVNDPEVPVLSVIDLGIVREVKISRDKNNLQDNVEIIITPTYSGCPAMDVIRIMIKIKMLENGYKNVVVTETLSPAWTTDWMSESGKQKLKEYGIAPPNPKQQVCDSRLFEPHEAVQCPHCNSYHTHRISEFGSTPCKSLFVCDNCKEPFDYFKCH